MESVNENQNETSRELRVERLLNAPLEKVWEAWSRLENLDRWWGPDGFTNQTESFEFKEGGLWVFTMVGPDGTEFPNRILYTKIVPGKCICNRHDRGEAVPDDPHAFETEVTFSEEGDKTRIVLNSIFKTAEARDYIEENYQARKGGEQHLANCEKFILANLTA